MDLGYRLGNVEALVSPFKLIGERHPVNQRMGTVVILSQTRVLSKIEMSVLQRGLSFVPSGTGMGGNSWNRLEAEAGLTEYHRWLKIAVFFREEGREGQRAPFTIS